MSNAGRETFVTQLVCVLCGAKYSPGQAALTCPHCPPGEGILDVHYDLARVADRLTAGALSGREHSHWRYAELLPLSLEALPKNLPVGWTPVTEAPRLATRVGVRRLLLKDDTRNPSASFKDRASSVGVARAVSGGAHSIACASTGNAATSLACACAAAGARAYIFVPAQVPPAKLAQMSAYGATVLKVRSSYADAYDLCMSACSEYGWYNRNCAVNPYLVEGKKTAGLEIAEQCANHMPDWVAVGLGDGCTLAGIFKGLKEMHDLGLSPRLPRILGVQAEGAAPILYALQHDRLPEAAGPGTIADSINVPVPRNWRKAVNAVRCSNGAIVTVSDRQMLGAISDTAALAGVLAEPAAAASVAGIANAVRDGIIDPADSVLAVITGSGLKDTNSARRAAGPPLDIEPDLAALAKALNTGDSQ